MKIRFLLAAFILAAFSIPTFVLFYDHKTEQEPQVRVLVKGKVKNSTEFQERLDLQAKQVAEERAALEKELECLAINIYKEAGYEPLKGQLAVAQVTLNRVEHREFPNSICEVVYERNRNRNTGKIVCQFSWACDPVHRNRKVHEPSYQQSYDIARQALVDGARIIGLEDALFYHATYINPRWRLERVQTIGLHTFYRIPQQRQVLASR
jgi:spore germination cell wall hydrolase CwlJ-like protein